MALMSPNPDVPSVVHSTLPEVAQLSQHLTAGLWSRSWLGLQTLPEGAQTSCYKCTNPSVRCFGLLKERARSEHPNVKGSIPLGAVPVPHAVGW